MSLLRTAVQKILSGMLPSSQSVSKIIIKGFVVEDIIDFAKENYPKEFVAILQGKVRKDTAVVDGLLYQPFVSASHTAVMHINLPMISDSLGSVHSHPGRSNTPSRADLQFFAKRGIVNLIICAPYRKEDIACYDFEGNRREFETLD